MSVLERPYVAHLVGGPHNGETATAQTFIIRIPDTLTLDTGRTIDLHGRYHEYMMMDPLTVPLAWWRAETRRHYWYWYLGTVWLHRLEVTWAGLATGPDPAPWTARRPTLPLPVAQLEARP